MTERRSRRRKRESESEDEENEASEEQTEIAKHLRFNCETKSSNYKSQKVEYFKGSKAIDCLLDSKWAASGKGGTEILFTDRDSVRNYLQDAAIQAKMEVAGVNLHGDSRKILPRSKIVVKKLYFSSAQDIQCNLHEIENTCSRTEHAVLNSCKSRHNSYF